MLVFQECLLRSVLFLAAFGNVFVLFGHVAFLEPVELLLVVCARCRLVLAARIELALEDFCVAQLVRIVCQRVIPLGS